MKRTALKRGTKTLKRGRIKKVGKVGRANAEANKILREKLGGISYCEMRLQGCLGTWPLQFAHRHKRIWYKGDPAKLSDPKQVIVACQACHEKTEYDRELNDKVFQEIRGDE